MFSANKGLITQDRQFRLLRAGLGNKRLIKRLIARKVVLESRLRLFGAALYDRPIGLADLLVTLEHLIQTRERFARTGKKYYSTRRTIEPMGHTQEHLSGLVVLSLYVRLHRLAQRGVTGLIALHDLVAGLVNGNNMVIFVKNSHYQFNDLTV